MSLRISLEETRSKKTARLRAVFYVYMVICVQKWVLFFVFLQKETHQYHDVPNFLLVHVRVGFAQHLDPIGLDRLPVEYLTGDRGSTGLNCYNRPLHCMTFAAFRCHHSKRRLILRRYARGIEVHVSTASLDLDSRISGGYG